MGGQEWDAIVTNALQGSGVDGTMMLGGSAHPVAVPFGLPALMTALLHFVAPDAPGQLRVYTYDVLHIGCLLEVRGARALQELPEQLTQLAQGLGVKLRLFCTGSSSSVQLTLPMAA